MATQNVREPNQNGTSLRGIGGWLLYFCIGSIIGPLVSIGAEKNGLNPLVIAVVLAMSAFSIYTAISLWRVQRNALEVVKTYFIVSLGSAILVVIGLFSTESAQARAFAGGQAIHTLIYVAVWWSYFKKSKRVKATFGRNLGEAVSPEPTTEPREPLDAAIPSPDVTTEEPSHTSNSGQQLTDPADRLAHVVAKTAKPQKARTIFCINCGEKNPYAAKFCRRCSYQWNRWFRWVLNGDLEMGVLVTTLIVVAIVMLNLLSAHH